jgi:hypothetical protein
MKQVISEYDVYHINGVHMIPVYILEELMTVKKIPTETGLSLEVN